MTIFGMANLKESATADFNSQLPPAINKTSPKSIKKKSPNPVNFGVNIDQDFMTVDDLQPK